MSNDNKIEKDQIEDGEFILNSSQHAALIQLLLNGGTPGGSGDALNSEVVHLEGDETINNIKTFTTQPVIPDPVNVVDIAKVQTVIDRIKQSSALRIVGTFGPGSSQLPVTTLLNLPVPNDANTYGLFPAFVCVVEEANAPFYDTQSDTEWFPLDIAVWASTMGTWIKLPASGVRTINGKDDTELILGMKDLDDVQSYSLSDVGKTFTIQNVGGKATIVPSAPATSGSTSIGAKQFPEYMGGKGCCPYVDGLVYINTDDEVVVIGANNDSRIGAGQGNMEFPGMSIPLPPGVTATPTKLYVNGGQNILVLCDNGRVYGSGRNNKNQLGLPGTTGTGNIAQLTQCAISNVAEVILGDAGSETIGYLTTNGQLYIMGENQHGQCGTGNTNDVLTIGSPVLTNVVKCISGGSWNGTRHAQSFLALLSDGTVRHVGYGGGGQHGNGAINNTNFTWSNPLSGITSATIDDIQVAGGDAKHTYVVKTTTNILYGWGDNDRGVLGLGNTSVTSTPVSIKTNVSQYWMHGGYPRMFVKLTSGQIQGSGDGANGKLGKGSAGDTSVFVSVPFPNGIVIAEMYGYGGTETDGGVTIAVDTDGHIWSCGYNEHGECGLGRDGADVVTFEMMYTAVNNDRKTIKSLTVDTPSVYVDHVSGSGGKAFMITAGDELYGCGHGRWKMFSRSGDNANYVTKLHVT